MDNQVRTHFQFKGIRDGLLVVVGEGNWPELELALLAQIEEQSAFLKGARLALDVGNHTLKAADLGTLRNQLADRNVSLYAVISNSPLTEQNSQALGLATRLSAPRQERVIKPLDTNLSSGDETVFVQKTLRSGFKVSGAGHVVVIGDVNPGAEIIANGSIFIWGKLRGSVHAGAGGNQSAVICALELAPMQLRIAGVASAPIKKRGKPQPEICHIQDGQVIAEPWNSRTK
jgi:septum site-determining protein MinC